MKTILALLILVIALVANTQAQQYSVSTLSTGTNVIAASGTLSPASAVVTATKNDNIALQMTFALSGTGVGNVVMKTARSVDGVTYETVPSGTLTVAASGTNTVGGVLNISTAGAGYVKVVSVENANTPSTVAGLVIKAAKKPNN